MNYRQLEAFRAVMETGSVTRAAEHLCVSQPAISKLLALLERSCGFDLFERHGNRLVPTIEAQVLIGEVDRLFVGMDHVERRAQDIRDLRSGHLAIAAFPAIGTRFLPKVIARFHGMQPDIRTTLVTKSGRTLMELVGSNQVDLGIGLLSAHHASVDFMPAGSFPGVCVMHPSHPLAAKRVINASDLDGVPFISLGSEDRSRHLVDHAFEHYPIQRNIVAEAYQAEAACALAACGLGVAIVEPFSASGFLPDQLAIKPFEPTVRFTMWFMVPSVRPRSRLLEAFTGLLLSVVAEEANFADPEPSSRGNSKPAALAMR